MNRNRDPEFDRRDPATQTRRTDVITRARLEGIHDDYVRWGNRTVHILVGIAVIIFVFGCLDVYLWQKINENTKHNQALSADIQQSRARAELQRCQEQNFNHDAGLAKLRALTATNPRLTASVKVAALKQDKAIMDSILPKADCILKVKQLTGVNLNG
jgi:CHASE3 domain sensor protein